jgi:hypothetical protein
MALRLSVAAEAMFFSRLRTNWIKEMSDLVANASYFMSRRRAFCLKSFAALTSSAVTFDWTL